MYLQISCGGKKYNKNGVSIKLNELSDWSSFGKNKFI